MANNYVIYDKNGLLADSELKPISKGNNRVDNFYIAFKDYDYTNTYVTIATTLPDGNSLPELTTSISDFFFNAVDYKGYKFEVTEPLTAQAGVLTITFHLKSKEDDRRLASSMLNVTIHDSDVATEPSIDNAQYENLIVTIDNNAKELDSKKLNKNFTTYDNLETPIGTENVIVYTADGENRRIYLDNLHNIIDVNGVRPVNRSITLTASNINHNEKNIGDAIDDLTNEVQEKANINEAVFHRNGTLEEIVDIKPTGVLNHTTDTRFSEYNFARVILSDTDFEDGDIVTCDVNLEIQDNMVTRYTTFSFTRVLQLGDTTINHSLVISNGEGGFENVTLYGGVTGNVMGFRIETPNTYIYKPTITYSIVRRG